MAGLNELDLFIQEEHKLLIDTVDKMSAFNDKLRLLNTRVEENKIASFSNLNHILIFPRGERFQFCEYPIEIQNDIKFKQMFRTTSLTEFWTNVKKQQPVLWHEAKYVFRLPLPTYNMWKAGFSQLTVIKT